MERDESRIIGLPESEHDDVQTSIVIPAFNEEKNLRALVKEILGVAFDESISSFSPVEVIVVDDGSTDDTADVIQELADEFPDVRGVFLRRNFGQSAALAAGFDVAQGLHIVTMDADQQNNPADIPVLLQRLSAGYDCVSGWRRDRNDPLSKTIPSKVQTYFARATGPDIHDFGCTLKAYRREAINDILLHGEGHRYIPAKLHKRGYRITEVPVDHRPRRHGQSNYGIGRLVKGFMDLLFNAFWNNYSARPLHFLGGLGFYLMLVGGLIGIHSVVMKYGFGNELTPHLPRLVLTVALILFGFQLVMFGFLAEVLVKILYRDEEPYRIQNIYDGRVRDE